MSSPQKIFICGFMGSGKTTHGRKLASELRVKFIDLDKFIEEKEGCSVQAIFSVQGEQAFRELETNYLNEILSLEHPLVVSLGGGTVCFNDNLKKVLDQGLLVYIKMPAEALFRRLINSKQPRPLLKDKNQDEILEFIKTTLDHREQFYSSAQITVDGIDLKPSLLKETIQAFKKS